MRKVKHLSIFTGKDVFSLDLTDYDEIIDESLEFEDHTEFTIGFYKNGKLVRRLWNPSCDITYQEVES